MSIPPTLERWLARARDLDRARVRTFARFLLRRFFEDRLLQAAGALAYTTALSLVPLVIVVFGVLSAFPVVDAWSEDLTNYVFSNFVPTSAYAIREWLFDFRKNVGALTAAGTVALVLSLLVTIYSIEATFNRIWRVPTVRPKVGRLTVYWTMLSLGGLVAAASVALSAQLFALALFKTEPGRLLEHWMVSWSPVAIEFFALLLVYRVVPHRTIQWRHAFAGAVLAVLMIEAVKGTISLYFGSFSNYQTLYGALAFVPIFLVWIYMGWVSILFGASLASSLAAFRYQPASQRLPRGYELYGLLRLVGRFREARVDGRGLHLDDIRAAEPMLTDGLVQEMLAALSEANVVRRAESGEWLLARDLDDVTLAELYDACHLRIPINEAWLPMRDDLLGERAVVALDAVRLPLRDLLRRPVSSLFQDPSE